MSYLQKTREERDKSQNEVSAETGVSRQQLHRLESGEVVASAEQAEALRKFLGIPILESKHVVDFSEMRRRSGIRPFLLDKVDPQPWKTARSNWKLRVSAEVLDWMSQFLPADSARECYGLDQCVEAGAQPFVGNPHQWGFDALAVVDRLGKLLGARVLPGLAYSEKELDIVLWPQVCLRVDDRHVYRVDALMFFRYGRKRFWLIVEFDCEGHDSRRDAYRSGKIGLPEVRINGEEVRLRKVFSLLVERAKAAVGLPA
ncbi:MAG: helix-turn-helix transcriptional regulator [Candidatus Eremiobacteraeota bacterium]|nr:helix-turn-helix transcriptional regulator [Candidatus Eremiobacteraeota bacterium]